jgi:hypothetical protein
LKEIAQILFLVDITLMFCGMIFANAAAWWVFIPFHVVATTYVTIILCLAWRAAKIIQPSFKFQRPIGITLYLPAHLIQFCFTGQVPIGLVGYVLIAFPLAVLFLFEE